VSGSKASTTSIFYGIRTFAVAAPINTELLADPNRRYRICLSSCPSTDRHGSW
jgi:hypothetical protein